MACLPARVHTDTHWERHIQTDPHTHTNTGRPIDLLSSPPVVRSGFWLSPGPPFKGSAVVWANKAVAQDGAITTGLARIFLLAPKEMFPWLSPVSPVNVFTLNSPAGHSAWYVGRTHACVHVCAYIYVSSKVTWRLPPPVRMEMPTILMMTVIPIPLIETVLIVLFFFFELATNCC